MGSHSCPPVHPRAPLLQMPSAFNDSRIAVTSISTILTPAERLRVDAAGEGLYRALHRHNIEDVIRDLKEQGVSAAVMASTDSEDIAEIARHYGAEVPFLRPPAFAGDTSPDNLTRPSE